MNLRPTVQVALALLLPSLAQAEEQPEPPTTAPVRVGSLETGFRSGLGIAVGGAGDFADGTKKAMSDLVSSRIPLWLDLNYRWSEQQTLGLYGQFGLGGDGEACQAGCNSSDLRVGLQSQWHFGNPSASHVWFGVGLGYQWLNVRNTEEVALDDSNALIDLSGLSAEERAALGSFGVQRSESLHGPELLLQGGYDFAAGGGLSVGPYVSATLSTYLADSQECFGLPSDNEALGELLCPALPSENSALHAWLGFGLRGTYAP